MRATISLNGDFPFILISRETALACLYAPIRMIATKISGTMMTSDCAPVKGASAVDALEVEVATVETSDSPMTTASRTPMMPSPPADCLRDTMP